MRKLVFGRGPNGEVGACVECELYGRRFQMVIDTGSTITMMNQSIHLARNPETRDDAEKDNCQIIHGGRK